MKKEINIAEILKDKPYMTKLYSPCCGVCSKGKDGNSERPITLYLPNRVLYHLLGNGKEFETGEIMVYPSKKMRDWAKFAWKKGDVLIAGVDNFCIFDSWANDDYTEFHAKFVSDRYECEVCKTSVWTKETNENIIKQYISKIEEIKCGNLNLSTLEIEKPQFKDGDIVAIVSLKKYVCVAIYKMRQEQNVAFHAVLCNNGELLLEEPFREDDGDIELRLSTDSEKQQLFDALAKENKAWDAEKKAIVDLPKKCELKAFDKVLARMGSKDYWRVSLYSHKTGYYHICIDGSSNLDCIPYNDQTAHLLGTTKEYEA